MRGEAGKGEPGQGKAMASKHQSRLQWQDQFDAASRDHP